MMRYRDLTESLDWLCNALGFERDCVVRDSDGAVIYAQLVLGRGMVMLGPVGESDFDALMLQPGEVGGAETQSCYLAVRDIDAHYEHAKAAGAEILIELTEDGAGGRGYCCRDPGGHIWNFGTFDPWEHRPAPIAVETEVGDDIGPETGALGRIARATGQMMLGAGIGAVGFIALSLYAPHLLDGAQSTVRELAYTATQSDRLRPQPAAWDPNGNGVPQPKAALQRYQDGRIEEAERKLRAAEQANRAQEARLQAAENSLRSAAKASKIQNDRLEATERKLHATEQAERMQVERLEDAEQRLRTAENAQRAQAESLEEAQRQLRTAEASKRDIEQTLAREQSARRAADQALRDAQQELASERETRMRAEQTALSMSEELARERLSGRQQAKKKATLAANEKPQKLAALQPPVAGEKKAPPSQAPQVIDNAKGVAAPADKTTKSAILIPIKKEKDWQEFRDAKEAADKAKAAERARQARERREERRRRQAARASKPKSKPKPKKQSPQGWPFSGWN